MGVLEGRSPSPKTHFPLSFEGEGDKGGEVDKNLCLTLSLSAKI